MSTLAAYYFVIAMTGPLPLAATRPPPPTVVPFYTAAACEEARRTFLITSAGSSYSASHCYRVTRDLT